MVDLVAIGSQSCVDTVKGVKRKKIVTENHLKKIPKSPLRNVSKEKQGHDLEVCTSQSTSPSGSIQSKVKELLTHKQNSKEGKGTSAGLNDQTAKSAISMQARKLGVPLDLCNGRSESYNFDSKMTLLKESSTSSSIQVSMKSANIDCENISKHYLCANSAFDVLLKAMEPELNTLDQSRAPCGTQTEKQGHKSESPSVSYSSLSPASSSERETNARYFHHHRTAQFGQPCTTAKESPHTQVHSGCEEGQFQKRQPPTCHNYSSVLDVTKQQVYHVAVTSSIVNSPSAVTQVISLPGSSSLASPSNCSLSNTYNVTQVASLITGEQMCNIVLKDQKPKKQGKYICEYCNRACAKPSVLLKHIRSHTGERPYPCVTCGFSFKTKSNLYKHKKSHAHAIKLGRGRNTETGGMLLSQDSEKALFISSDVDESGESDEEYTSEERQDEFQESIKMSSESDTNREKEELCSSNSPVVMVQDNTLQEKPMEVKPAELPKVVVYPVSVSPLRADSPKVLESTSEQFIAQIPELKIQNKTPNVLRMCSLSEVEQSSHKMCELIQAESKQSTNINVHAQLQRQQATDCSQEQQSKCLLSPRSLGSTDSGYFSRSDSAGEAMTSPSPFIKLLPSSEKDFSKNISSLAHTNVIGAVLVQPCMEKPPVSSGIMRPPLGTKTLEERISKLISDNEAVVDDKQLDSVKPRRTSLSRRGSIDSPKSYIFKDSFQFDLKPAGRRTSSSSDIPKSPFTPTEKSKQVFFLSVPTQYPSIDCLPITRSNSMPTTGYSAIPPVIPASHPLRGSQSFDDKIGSLCDDVFVSGPSTPQHTVHPRTLVRQAAVEDSTTEHCGLGPARSVDESYPGSKAIQDALLPRSKSFVQSTSLDKIKKSHQGRGTMYECETCRNRYRKQENYENHKKFYCSELHGPKSKTAARETDHGTAANNAQPQIFHYRVASTTGTLEQPLLIRKRRKMKSVGEDDEPQQSECRSVPENIEAPASVKASSTITISGSQSCTVSMLNQQMQLISRSTEPSTDVKTSAMETKTSFALKESVDLKCQGSGISVIQHTNSLSRPSSFEKSESVERVSSVRLCEIQKKNVKSSLNAVGVIQEDRTIVSSQITPNGSHEVTKHDTKGSHQAVLGERTAASQSRLVRQHNIQVPEILVTEEPDKNPENQTTDPEIQEKFTWPQRSGSLSSLPTEKLPPKKKRIRLADLDNSSAESSFESTLSRSLSRESSLSRTSSFSASFEKEEFSKSENVSKTDSINKSSEFLTIPTGLNIFGAPREMRRAASEQISCTQSSMEVTDYRSKSFDCGSMSRSRSMSPINIVTSRSSLVCSTSSGHVPLLERRRGPLAKQISLSISETSISPGKSKISENPTLTQQINRTLTEVNVCSKENNRHTHVYDQQLEKSKLTNVSDSRGSVNASKTTLFKTDFPNGMQSKTNGDNKEKHMLPNKKYECKPNFAPKYQLECLKAQESQSYSIKPVTIILPNSPFGDSSITSQNLQTDVKDGLSNVSQTFQKQNQVYCNYQSSQSVFVPVHNYSSSLYYGYSAITSLPEILVTQDKGNSIVCKANSTPVSETIDPLFMPKSQEDHSRSLMGSVKNFENCLPRSVPQKLPAVGLFPHPETSASSKRMLSPANSLDIAMEKQQKRVKDESGAACNTNNQNVHLLTMKAAEHVKQRKPMLVRQFCTTDPGESLDHDISQVTCIPENHSPGAHLAKFQSSTNSASDGKGIEDYEKIQSLEACPTVRMSPEPSPLNTLSSSLKPTYSNQERRSPVSSKTIHIQGQVKLSSAISVVNAGDMHRLSFPSLKTSTSFTWCYLLKRKPIAFPQNDQKTSAYASWTISSNNPNPLNLPTKAALSLLNSKQKGEKFIFTLVKNSHQKHDTLVYSSKWKSNSKKSSHHKACNPMDEPKSIDASSDQDKEPFQNRSEPRRVKIFDGGFKSNEEYVYVRGRGRGKYICEECGIRCKKPSMLKKHIRTHTDVRPYHCNYCNFSFKTKGNLTKHMKSKAHSKKCMDMGIAVCPGDDQDTDDSGERQRYSGERSGFDGDDSDGAEDDDNDNEDEDEDSQAESVLSATPSVTASPQHYPFRNSQQEASSTDEDCRVAHSFPQDNSMDILPKALITKMSALTTATICKPESHEEKQNEGLQDAVLPQSEASSPISLCHQMSVDYPDVEDGPDGTVESKNLPASHDPHHVNIPSSPVNRSTQTMDSSAIGSNHTTQHPAQITTAQTHLFSHLPLHSQQPVRSPYSMIPVGGIQLVPAGLTAYSTFVPFPTGQVQLTIPAVGVIHRTTGPHSDKPAEVPNTQSPIGVAEVNGVLPCIPIGQVNVPGLSASGLQPIQPLSMEAVNILGLSNPNITPQIHSSGLTLNAVGLQVLATSPGSQSNTSPQAHIPGLQILNIALPTLIPSISPLSVDGQGVPDRSPSCSTAPCQGLANIPGTDAKIIKPSESLQVASKMQESPKASGEATIIEERATTCGSSTEIDSQLKQGPHVTTSQIKTSVKPDLSLKIHSPPLKRLSIGHALPPLRHQRRTELVSRQNTVQLSDSSSDDDEGRLVIAT
ncbi:zinc finger protein 40 isoform X2 [Ranitomeya variabilis]|uniref:zinc finger protein 40 isoform X2 n=1 Tax=Ranitomeya variabilis TaxID=490064 RepID=UPI0040575C35